MATDLVRVGQHDVTREATVRVFRGFVQAYSAASERRQRAPTNFRVESRPGRASAQTLSTSTLGEILIPTENKWA